MKKTFTNKKGSVNEKVQKWLAKHPDIQFVGISGNHIRVEVIYEKIKNGEPCGWCDGTGEMSLGAHSAFCHNCKGTGKILKGKRNI